MNKPIITATVTAFLFSITSVQADSFATEELPQMLGDTENTNNEWTAKPLVTIGEVKVKGKGFANIEDVNEEKLRHRPPGILDGIGTFKLNRNTVHVLVNHELNSEDGYAYQLDNGTELTGARVSFFDIDANSRRVKSAGPAFTKVYDRAGFEVKDPMQINEGFNEGGFDRFCSAYGFAAGTDGLADNIFFTGEETSEFGVTVAEGFGGQETVIDVDDKTLYVAPMMGRAAFENVCTVEQFGTDKVALIIGDDREAAPLYLYIGQKNAAPDSGYHPPEFLKRNGLGLGKLYVWVADDPVKTPDDFNGTGNTQSGKFFKINHFYPMQVGSDNYDSLGFASMALQDSWAGEVGAFQFSRPEDVAGNPNDGTQIVMTSTGRGGRFPSDNWGTIYLIDFDDNRFNKQFLDQDLEVIDEIPATLTILYDGDDAGGGQFSAPDFGIRSPDNVDWADDGFIYINEDRSTSTQPCENAGIDEEKCTFGAVSGIEASVWQLNPKTRQAIRILEMHRAPVIAASDGQGDPVPFDIGEWESSGVLDVTEHFKTKPGETLLILDVQAHSLMGGGLALKANQDKDLVEGGQLLFASNRFVKDDNDDKNDKDDK